MLHFVNIDLGIIIPTYDYNINAIFSYGEDFTDLQRSSACQPSDRRESEFTSGEGILH